MANTKSTWKYRHCILAKELLKLGVGDEDLRGIAKLMNHQRKENGIPRLVKRYRGPGPGHLKTTKNYITINDVFERISRRVKSGKTISDAYWGVVREVL